jgi:hypothetical protein
MYDPSLAAIFFDVFVTDERLDAIVKIILG